MAGPILRRSPVLDEEVLLEIARIKGQSHLLAMSERPKLSPDLTDLIVQRGDREVVRRTASNAGALFSDTGYSELIKRASQDGVLTITVGQRADLSDVRLKQLLAGSLDVIRRRLFDLVKPERQNAIKQAVAEITGVPERFESKRDFVPAQRIVLALHEAGNLNEAALLGFAKSHRYEESVATLSAMSGVKIPTLENLILSDRFDPILIVSKTIGLEWATVRALILLRLGPNRVPAPSDIESARVNFAKSDAVDRRAGGRLLEEPPVGVTTCRPSQGGRGAAMVAPKRATAPPSLDSSAVLTTAIRSSCWGASAASAWCGRPLTRRRRGWLRRRSRNHSDAGEAQIICDTPFALGFAAVARHGVAVPGQAPIVGALREPAKIRRAQQMPQRPGAVIVDIADEAKFAAGSRARAPSRRSSRPAQSAASSAAASARDRDGSGRCAPAIAAAARPAVRRRRPRAGGYCRYCVPRSAPGSLPCR